ncbi:MAG: extracellular solute-binding protein [Verrucomicrobiae bacterium]|nr:extracellular solute-binding protein [Verrucomicrobiae bacterium]NNJ42589.1 extracellular solute-binding protein [Akkermansiaceae bacterium]
MGKKQGGSGITHENADRRISIITPHNETIRREFGEAFQAWWKDQSGESVYVNWLTPGGTSEIRKIIDSQYAAAENVGDNGIGIDLMFGGGDYDFRRQADMGHLVELDVFQTHADWFQASVIPAEFTGETYYDQDRRWVGVCLSRFGICYNVDVLKRLGLDPPTKWADLGDPRYFGTIALADPSKSGSVARAFEMLIQQQMHESIASIRRRPGETHEQLDMRGRSAGWDNGINLIQRIAANARYFTDSATKIPHDVAQGNAAAGMCVDFYGRAYEEKLKKKDGSTRLRWISPQGGTSMSVDPVAVMRGAPNPEIAQRFVEFLLTEDGQRLWNAKPGTPGGTKFRALRRMPVRRDVYTEENMQNFSDPINPYEETGGFVYRRELTGEGFKSIQCIIRVMCLDLHDEMKVAWEKLFDAGMPERATKVFSDTTLVSYQNAMGDIRRKLRDGSKLEAAHMEVFLERYFRKNYKLAGKLAKEGK